MLDFTELSNNGRDLELLTREILASHGHNVRWSGVGPDGGKDLICIERRGSFFRPDERKWLVQCKHNAAANRAVGTADVGQIVDTCHHHHCTAYLLVCSTFPSSTLTDKLEGITSNSITPLATAYWDATKLEDLLTTPRGWPLAQRYFPTSSNAEDWRVWATERPNNWVINYKGYYFYLNNRIGSHNDNRLDTIRRRVEDLEEITLPPGHCLRLRAIYCDDKNASIKWYIDYLYPSEEAPNEHPTALARLLGDNYVLEDGHVHSFDIIHRCYSPHSDHHDRDHYQYYKSHDGSFIYGHDRPKDMVDIVEIYESADETKRFRDEAFETLLSKLSDLPFLQVVRSCNAEIEYLDRFYRQFQWTNIIEDIKLETDRFFSAWLLLRVHEDSLFHTLISYLPQSALNWFRLTRPCIYVPHHEISHRSHRDDDDEGLYEISFSVHPYTIGNKATGRGLLNAYFGQIVRGIDAFVAEHDRP